MYIKLKPIEKVAIQVILLLLALLWLYPLLQAFTQSLRVNGLGNYIAVVNHPKLNIWRILFNSFFIALTTGFIVTVFTALAAYAFSKMQFRFKNVLYYLLLVCLTIPLASVITPLFFTIKGLGLMNSYLAMILPMAAFQGPFLLMILKNYFDTIPNALLEAATIDGASSLRTLTTIMMPLAKPAFINIAVLSFIGSWNEYFIPLLFARTNEMYTVTIATTYFTGTQFQTPDMVAQLYATLMMMTIPSILLYIFSQRYLQEGLTAGAVKS